MTKKTPLISVVIPLYNHEEFIAKAIDSVLSQTFNNFELIIVDDGSTDKSAENVARYNNTSLTYVYQENKGTASALNLGIRISRGDYIAVLNSDDVYCSTRFEKALKVFNSDPAIQAVFSGIEFIDEYDQPLNNQDNQLENWFIMDGADQVKELPKRYKLLAGNMFYSSSNLICKKEVFDQIGFFENLKYVHDYDFFLRLCHSTQVSMITEPLLKYRFHSHNTLKKNYAESTMETALVLAKFLSRSLNISSFSQEELCDFMQRLYVQLNAYGSERLILIFMLIAQKFDPYNLMASKTCLALKNTILSSLQINRDKVLAQRDLAWQEKQTKKWWQQAQELKKESRWHQEQCHHWWQQAQESQKESRWHQGQCHHWWQQAQEFKKESNWHQEQCHYWWQQAQELKKESRWHQEQCHHWWQQAQEFKKESRWHQEQCHHWWQKAQKYKRVNQKLKFSYSNQRRKLMDLIKSYEIRDKKILYRLVGKFYSLLESIKTKVRSIRLN